MTNERDGFASAAVVRFVEALRNRDRELVVESVASAGTDSDVALDRWLKKAVRLRPQVDVNGWQIDDSWVVSTVELARLTLFTEPTALVRGAVRPKAECTTAKWRVPLRGAGARGRSRTSMLDSVEWEVVYRRIG